MEDSEIRKLREELQSHTRAIETIMGLQTALMGQIGALEVLAVSLARQAGRDPEQVLQELRQRAAQLREKALLQVGDRHPDHATKLDISGDLERGAQQG